MMHDRIKLFIPLLIFFLLVAVFFLLQNRMVTGEYDPSELPSALIGKKVPEFSLTTLGDDTVVKTRDDLVGKAALLNVWATWCISCRVEHAYLNQLAERGITVYGLNYKDDRLEANRWLERLGNPYQFNLFDSEGILGLHLGVYGAPETYVLDRKGVIRYRHVGVLNQNIWESKVLPLGLNW